MKRSFLIFILFLSIFLSVTSGCSKRENIMAGVAIVSAVGCGVSFLKAKEKTSRYYNRTTYNQTYVIRRRSNR